MIRGGEIVAAGAEAHLDVDADRTIALRRRCCRGLGALQEPLLVVVRGGVEFEA